MRSNIVYKHSRWLIVFVKHGHALTSPTILRTNRINLVITSWPLLARLIMSQRRQSACTQLASRFWADKLYHIATFAIVLYSTLISCISVLERNPAYMFNYLVKPPQKIFLWPRQIYRKHFDPFGLVASKALIRGSSYICKKGVWIIITSFKSELQVHKIICFFNLPFENKRRLEFVYRCII